MDLTKYELQNITKDVEPKLEEPCPACRNEHFHQIKVKGVSLSVCARCLLVRI